MKRRRPAGRDAFDGRGAPSAPVASQGPSRVPIVVAAALVVAAGIALRLWRIGSGLPDFLDEAIPWKTAFMMWIDERRVEWNPHFFNYPSLTIYLCLFLQKSVYAIGHAVGHYKSAADLLMDYEMDPSSLVIAARTMGILFDALTIAMVARIGERMTRWAGVIAAALVALSPTMIATSRAIYTDTYMTAFSVWALERMLAFRAEGKPRQLAAAAILIGLAAGSKYPALLLVIPLAWVLVERSGWKGLLPWGLASVAAAGVFFITTPYALLDSATFLKDVGIERFHMASGHLGSEGRGFRFQLLTLASDVGWVGVAMLVASLLSTAAAPRRHGDRVTLWLFLLPVGLAISLARVEAGRYIVPVVPMAAILAAITALDLALRVGVRAPLAAGVAAAALIVPLLPGGIAAGARGRDATEAQARRWCEANLPDSVVILREGYTANLFTRQRAEIVQHTRGFRTASADRQRRLLARRVFDVADLPLIASGDPSVVVESKGGPSLKVRVFEQSADINQIFYDLRLLHGVDYVLTSGAARGRYDADTARFAVQRQFYRFLDRAAEHVASFVSGADVSGPRVDIYRIGARAQDGIVAAGPLPALWWTEHVPQTFRREFEERVVTPELRSGGAVLMGDGRLAPWVLGLSSFFDKDILQFSRLLSWELSQFERHAAAEPLLGAIRIMRPGDLEACVAYARCAAALEHWHEVEVAAANTLAVVGPDNPALANLHYLRGAALARLGRKAEALRELDWARAHATPGSELAAAAAAEARSLGAAPR